MSNMIKLGEILVLHFINIVISCISFIISCNAMACNFDDIAMRFQCILMGDICEMEMKGLMMWYSMLCYGLL